MDHSRSAEEDRRTQVMLRSHVERCLQDIWDTRELGTDEDGDYPYRNGTAMCWVSADLHWAAVDRLALSQLVIAVGEVADDIGTLLATVYGGATPFPVELAAQDQDSDEGAA